MIPTPFEYVRPKTLEEAIGCLEVHGEEAKILAGGHSLLPAMKLRLAQPGVIIDLGGIEGLDAIRADQKGVSIGAMTTHYAIESSNVITSKCPLLSEVAATIGDVQVRNRGTLGGSLAHADPAADWPAAILALEAEIYIANRVNRRAVPAEDFFVDMMETAIQPTEVLVEIRVPRTGNTVAYEKFAQKASGFAIVGVAVVLDPAQRIARIGVTGLSAKPFRAREAEALLNGQSWTPELLRQAADRVPEGVEPLGDMHASEEFRVHLARVHAFRALQRACQT